MRENCQNNKPNDVVYAPFGGKAAAKIVAINRHQIEIIIIYNLPLPPPT
jgi:hypothetical protein